MKKRIGELLIEAGACTDNDVREALGHQRAWASNQKLGEVLVKVGKVTPTAVARALALQFDVPFVKLPEIPDKVSKTVPLNYQEEHKIVPFRLEMDGKAERLHIAVADPSNLDLVDELRFELRKTVRIYVAATDDIAQAISTLKGESLEELQPLEIVEEEVPPLEIERASASSTPPGWFGSAEKKVEPPPAEQLPEEWSLGPTPAAVEAMPKKVVTTDIDDFVGAAKPPPPAAAAPPEAEPPSEPKAGARPEAKARPPSEAQPFSSVDIDVAVDEEDSWGAALLPGGSGTAPRTSSKPETPSVAAPPTPPPAADTVSTAPAAQPEPTPKSVSAPTLTEPKPSAAASAPAAELPTSTRPPTGAVLNKAEPSATAAPAFEPEKPAEPKKTAQEAKPAEPAPKDKLEFSDDDLKILEDIERLASGAEPKSESEKVRPAQMVASLIRLLIKKGVIHELEFLDELARK